jgi:histone-lysine N-methyltransferase SETD2
VAKKLVRGDYKHGKVKNPTAKLEPKHERTVKKFVKDYMDKAVQKKAQRDKEKSNEERTGEPLTEDTKTADSGTPLTPDLKDEMDEVLANLSNDENLDSQQATPNGSSTSELKRKREGDGAAGSPKKTRTDDSDPPPPPPPPPTADMPTDGVGIVYAPVDEMGKAASPMQLATPPTTTNGSCEHDSDGKDGAADQLVNGISTTTAKVNGIV